MSVLHHKVRLLQVILRREGIGSHTRTVYHVASHTPKREVVSPSLAGDAKHRDFTVNHGVFITIGPIIKLSECFHLAAPALTDCQMDSNTF